MGCLCMKYSLTPVLVSVLVLGVGESSMGAKVPPLILISDILPRRLYFKYILPVTFLYNYDF